MGNTKSTKKRIGNRDVLTGHQVAALMNVNYKTFIYRFKAGDGPPTINRLGRPRWHRDTVEAWMRRGAVSLQPVQEEVA